MIIYDDDKKKKYDVLSNIKAAKLLELVQNECSDAIALELCVEETSKHWAIVKDPVLLKNKDKLRVVKVGLMQIPKLYIFLLDWISEATV